MKMWKVILPIAALLLLAGQAVAQSDQEEKLLAAESREAELERRMYEAEKRMAEAARQIAEITTERLPQLAEIGRRFEMSDKPRLGVTIDGNDNDAPVEGVVVMGVTPGSAASDAGLRSGDVVTSINDESLSAGSSNEANNRLLDFMKGVEDGDVLTVEYLRNGKVGSLEVEPRSMGPNVFVWQGDGGPGFIPKVPRMHAAPRVLQEFKMDFRFPWAGTGLGELEMVELNEGLGRYFGTDRGLLVINAPESDTFELQDGDVIQSIDGREPKDVRHAMRILSSYQSGEKLELGIMRDKKKRTLDVEIPANQRGMQMMPPVEIRPAVVPSPAAAPAPDVAGETA